MLLSNGSRWTKSRESDARNAFRGGVLSHFKEVADEDDNITEEAFDELFEKYVGTNLSQDDADKLPHFGSSFRYVDEDNNQLISCPSSRLESPSCVRVREMSVPKQHSKSSMRTETVTSTWTS